MAKLTRIKILNTGSTTTAPSNVKTGELAYSWVSGTQANNGDRLYIGTGTETSGVSAAVGTLVGVRMSVVVFCVFHRVSAFLG